MSFNFLHLGGGSLPLRAHFVGRYPLYGVGESRRKGMPESYPVTPLHITVKFITEAYHHSSVFAEQWSTKFQKNHRK